MTNKQSVLSTVNVTRVFDTSSGKVVALRDVNMEIYPGQLIAVVGRSGSGKTTLLNLMGGLDKATSGSVFFKDRSLSQMSESDLTKLRRHEIGFVFQSFGLIPLLSAFENVELPLRILGMGIRERKNRVLEVLDMVGLSQRANHRPYELSGGEQQRAAIARSMVTRPPLILADEPTGELDSGNAIAIFELFSEMVHTHGTSVVAATHDSTLLEMADQVKELSDGRLVEAKNRPTRFSS